MALPPVALEVTATEPAGVGEAPSTIAPQTFPRVRSLSEELLPERPIRIRRSPARTLNAGTGIHA
jgi:hypothetical protein